jgi:hypothetical protein
MACVVRARNQGLVSGWCFRVRSGNLGAALKLELSMVRAVVAFALVLALAGGARAEAPVYKPSSQTPPVPVIRTAAPESPCVPLAQMLAMARNGREAAGKPAFGDVGKASVLKAFLGSKECKAYANSEGGHTVNCTHVSTDANWPSQFRAYRGGTVAMCYPAWRRDEIGRTIQFTSPDRTTQWSVSTPDPKFYDPTVETTVRYVPNSVASNGPPAAALAKARTCATMASVAAMLSKNLRDVDVTKASGQPLMRLPVAGAEFCTVLPKTASNPRASIECLWRFPSAGGGEAAARAAYESWGSLMGSCRTGVSAFTSTQPLQPGQVARQLAADAARNEAWGTALSNPGGDEPWRVTLLGTLRDVAP